MSSFTVTHLASLANLRPTGKFRVCLGWSSQISLQGNQGVQGSYALVRGRSEKYVWWPGINADIEKSVRLCRECKRFDPFHLWRTTQSMEVDFAGPFQGKYILVSIDAHSK